MTNKLRAFFCLFLFSCCLFCCLCFSCISAVFPFSHFWLLPLEAGSAVCVFFAVAVAAVAALMALVITFNCHCKVFASHQKWQRLSADSIARLALTSCLLLAGANWRHLCALVSRARDSASKDLGLRESSLE